MALILDGLGSRAWPLVLAATSAFYGAFGAACLGVTIDLGIVRGLTAPLF
jgi:hypothetical protein